MQPAYLGLFERDFRRLRGTCTLREGAVDQDFMRLPRGGLLAGVQDSSVCGMQRRAPARQQLVREVAVEQHLAGAKLSLSPA